VCREVQENSDAQTRKNLKSIFKKWKGILRSIQGDELRLETVLAHIPDQVLIADQDGKSPGAWGQFYDAAGLDQVDPETINELQNAGMDLRELVAKHLAQGFTTAFANTLRNPIHERAWIAYQQAFLQEIRRQVKDAHAKSDAAADVGEIDILLQKIDVLASSPILLGDFAEKCRAQLDALAKGQEALHEEVRKQGELLQKSLDVVESVRKLVKGSFTTGENRDLDVSYVKKTEDIRAELVRRAVLPRKEKLEQLSEAVFAQRDADASGYFLLPGPAGSGKSVLLACWVQELEHRDDVVVFSHFFSRKAGTESPEIVWASIAQQLMRQFCISGPSTEATPGLGQAVTQKILAMPHEKRFVLVMDGLDELSGALHEYDFGALSSNTFVVFSHRTTSAHTAEELCQRLRLKTITELPPPGHLASTEIEVLLRAHGVAFTSPETDLGGLADRILEKTGGLAIYADSVSADIARQETKEKALAVLECLPRGFENYVIEARGAMDNTSDDACREAFDLLSLAIAPMELSTLAGLVRFENGPRLDMDQILASYRGSNDSIWKLTRWLTLQDDGTVRIQHAAVAEAVRMRLRTGGREEEYTEKLLRFCRMHWPEGDRYALQYLPAHLAVLDRDSELYELAHDCNFLDAQSRFDPLQPLITLRLAFDVACGASLVDAGIVAEFALAHAERCDVLLAETPTQALRKGSLTRAMRLIGLILEPVDRLLNYLMLAFELQCLERFEERRDVLERIDQHLPRLRDTQWESQAAAILLGELMACGGPPVLVVIAVALLGSSGATECLIKHLPHSRLDESLNLAAEIQDEKEKAHALACIAIHLAESGRLDESREIAMNIQDCYYKASAFAYIAIVLIGRGQLDESLKVAAEIQHVKMRAYALVHIAVYLTEAGRLDESLELTAGIQDEENKARALASIAAVFVQGGRLDDIRELAVGIQDQGHRNYTLARFATALADQGRLDESLELAAGIQDQDRRNYALAHIATALADQGRLDESLELAAGIKGEELAGNALGKIATVFAQHGRLEDIRELAAGIPDEVQKAYALGKIVTVFAQHGRLEDIRELAAGIQYEDYRAYALTNIAAVFAQENRLDDIRELAAGIEDEYTQAHTLRDIASIFAEQGHLDEGLKLAASIQDRRHDADALAHMAIALAKQGRLDESHKVAAKIQNWSQRSSLLHNSAVAYAQRGRLEDIRELTAALENKYDEPRALAKIAYVLAEQDRLDESLVLAARIQDDKQKASMLAHIAHALAEQGKLDESLVLAARIQDDEQKASVLAHIVHDLAEQGRLDESCELAARISDNYYSAIALSGIASVLAEQGQLGEVRRLTAAIQEGNQKAFMLAHVASALAAQGLLDESSELAMSIQDQHYKGVAFLRIAIILADGGQYDESLKYAEAIQDANKKASVLAAIAPAFAEQGRFGESRELAVSIKDPYYKASALSQIAIVLADQGQLDESLELSEGIQNDVMKADALVHIAPALVAQSRLDESRELAASIRGEYNKAFAHSKMAIVLAEQGRFGESRDLIAGIQVEERKAYAIANVAPFFSQQGQLGVIRDLAAAIQDEDDKAGALVGIAKSLPEATQAVLDLAQQILVDRLENYEQIAAALVEAGNQEALLGLIGLNISSLPLTVCLMGQLLRLQSEKTSEIFHHVFETIDRAWGTSI